jgi:hypothetical protein
MRLVEMRFGRPIADLLRDMRATDQSVSAIADRLEVPYGTVHRWLREFGLDASSLIRQGVAGHEASIESGRTCPARGEA